MEISCEQCARFVATSRLIHLEHQVLLNARDLIMAKDNFEAAAGRCGCLLGDRNRDCRNDRSR